MPTATVNIFVALRPLFVLHNRLLFHTQDGEMLHGLKYKEKPVVKNVGEKDLPYIAPLSFLEEEDMSMGGAGSAKCDVITAEYQLGANAAHGFMRFDTTSTKLGILEWVTLVRDAMETNEAGEVDRELEKMAIKPIRFSTEDNTVDQLVASVTLKVEIFTRVMQPGKRACYTVQPS